MAETVLAGDNDWPNVRVRNDVTVISIDKAALPENEEKSEVIGVSVAVIVCVDCADGVNGCVSTAEIVADMNDVTDS